MLLNGIKVVSFCHFLQGPAGAQYLADMGADVIKVEPIEGAHERHWSGADVYVEGVSGFYLCANRNKRSIGIDLKSAEGKEVARRLIAAADVVMENFRPGVFAKLGFDAGRARRNQSEPYLRLGQRLRLDRAAGGEARSGPSGPGSLRSDQRDRHARAGADAVGAAIVDQHGGALLAMGILGALVRRLREGKRHARRGQPAQRRHRPAGRAAGQLFRRRNDARRAEARQNLATWFHGAPYGVYPARDGHVVVSLCDAATLAEALESDALREVARSTATSNATNTHVGWPGHREPYTVSELANASTARHLVGADHLLRRAAERSAARPCQGIPAGQAARPHHSARQSPEPLRRRGARAARAGARDRRAHTRDPRRARLRR